MWVDGQEFGLQSRINVRGLGNPPICPTSLCKKGFISIAGHTTIFLSALQTLSQARALFCADPKACESLEGQSSGMRINLSIT